MQQRSKQPRSWVVLLTSTLLLLFGCHFVLGDFEEKPAPGPVTGLCAKGSFRCKDEFLLTCNADQSAWMLKDTCASKDQCSSDRGSCLVCPQADALRCNGAILEICNAKRVSWDFNDDCHSAELCSPGGCGPCKTPGDLQCTIDPNTKLPVIRECDPVSSIWKPVVGCINEDLCEDTIGRALKDPASWNRKCDPACTPGAFRCDGANLQRCPQNGVNWMAASSCGSPALCQRTLEKLANDPNLAASTDMCDPGCGGAGQLRCTNNTTLQRCSDDSTEWQTIVDCPAGKQCSTEGQGSCIVCTPGHYQCNGTFLERCDEQNTWKQVQDCKSHPLCGFQNDVADPSKSTGRCEPPACANGGETVCGSETDRKVAGATLWTCKDDLTDFVKGITCETPELCHAADKACALPLCKVGTRRCNPKNLLEVQECNSGETDWNSITTCKSGEICDATDKALPCKHECPAPLICNQRVLQTCSAAEGVKTKAQCDTNELCACAVAGTCTTKADGCGSPVCTAGTYRCTGSFLEQCNPGRDGWTRVSDCGSSDLCYPGPSPAFTNGYCAVCPPGGEVQCMGSATQTCANDRKSWINLTSCTFGCVNSSTVDYCAQCSQNEKRCSGGQVLQCSGDQKVLTVQSNCQFGCVDSGTNDYCGVCFPNEKRCTGTAAGSRVQLCAADQKSLANSGSACSIGCVDSGTNDYCAECVDGQIECVGAGVHTCTMGKWGTVTSCPSGGCVDSGTLDYCAGCSKGELRCSGDALLSCNADQKGMTPVAESPCANGCVDNALTDYCATCRASELRCVGSTLQQCSADRTALGLVKDCGAPGCVDSGTTDYCAVCKMGETRCMGSMLQGCALDRKSLTDVTTCTMGCYDAGDNDYCGECRPGDTQCTTGGYLTCGTDGRWGAVVTACSGACVDSGVKDYCAECKAGDTQCTTGGVVTCGTDSRWGTMATACANGCIDSGAKDYCAECKAGDTQCTTGGYVTCGVDGHWGTTATACTDGCIDSGTKDYCADCQPGTSQCGGTMAMPTVQTCDTAGHWGMPSACPNGCNDMGTMDKCQPCPLGTATCSTDLASLKTCMTGAEVTSACDNGCFDNGTMDYCRDCKATQAPACSTPTTARSCGTNGRWSDVDCAATSQVCLDGACVAPCTPGAGHCEADGTHIRTCSETGTWGDPTPCPTTCNATMNMCD